MKWIIIAILTTISLVSYGQPDTVCYSKNDVRDLLKYGQLWLKCERSDSINQLLLHDAEVLDTAQQRQMNRMQNILDKDQDMLDNCFRVMTAYRNQKEKDDLEKKELKHNLKIAKQDKRNALIGITLLAVLTAFSMADDK